MATMAWLAPILLSAVVVGSTCPSRFHSDSLTGEQASARARAIQALLDDQRAAHDVWQIAWVLGLGGSASGLGAASNLLEQPGRRAGLIVSAAKAAIGVVVVATRTLHRHSLAGIDRLDDCARLSLAEAGLLELAQSQGAGTAWRRGGSIALNVAGTLIVGLGYDEWVLALISGGVGLLVGELILHTEPAAAIDAVEVLRQGRPLTSRDDSSVRIDAWLAPASIAFSFRF